MVTRSKRYTPPKSRWRLHTWPRDNAALRKPAAMIVDFDDALRDRGLRLAHSMHENNGIGLAAPQMGLNAQLLVADDNGTDMVLCNPTVLDLEGEHLVTEGCLSVPNILVEVERYRRCTVSAQDWYGEEHTHVLEGRTAHIVQHEIDHLNGMLMVDLLNESQTKSLNNLMREFSGFCPVVARLQRSGGVKLG